MEAWTSKREGVDYVHFKKRGDSSKSKRVFDTRIYAYYSDPRTRITITKRQFLDALVKLTNGDGPHTINDNGEYYTTLSLRDDVISLQRKKKTGFE